MTQIGKGVKFKWQENEQRTFETLEEAFVSMLILCLLDWTQPVVVEIDVSGLHFYYSTIARASYTL